MTTPTIRINGILYTEADLLRWIQQTPSPKAA